MEVNGHDGAAAVQDRSGALGHQMFTHEKIDYKTKIMGLGEGGLREERFLKKAD